MNCNHILHHATCKNEWCGLRYAWCACDPSLFCFFCRADAAEQARRDAILAARKERTKETTAAWRILHHEEYKAAKRAYWRKKMAERRGVRA